jgi:glycogen(starch) synthase
MRPFGIVALEAMAAHCPVVVSNVGGLAEVVTRNETGIIVQPDDVESLAWGIGEILSKPDESAKLAASAYNMVNEKYTWDRIADRVVSVYDRVLRERRQAVWR